MTILVSSCLLGVHCRYDGKGNETPWIMALQSDHTLIPVCPEILGGLPVPRLPAERRGSQVVNQAGQDVTAFFRRGAALACEMATQTGCAYAILKERSPSCGKCRIYDGSFSGKRIAGQGMAAEQLTKAGVLVFSEEEAVLFQEVTNYKQSSDF